MHPSRDERLIILEYSAPCQNARRHDLPQVAAARARDGRGRRTFLVLLGITLTTQLVRLLGQAATGSITSTGVVALLGFSLVNYLPVLLSLTLFIAVLMTLSRSYRDSEMVVWFSSGVGLTRVDPARARVRAAARRHDRGCCRSRSRRGRSRRARSCAASMESRDDVSAISPGVFRESRHAERVYFVEEVSGAQNMVANVFVSSSQHREAGRHGGRARLPGDRRERRPLPRAAERPPLRRRAGHARSTRSTSSSATRCASNPRRPRRRARPPPSRSRPSTCCATRRRANLAELSWRIGLPVSALILSLLAIPLSFVNPRAGRSMNLVLALLIYMIYSNLLSISQAWIAQSRISLVDRPVGRARADAACCCRAVLPAADGRSRCSASSVSAA